MTVKIPQYEITLCVKVNDVFKVITQVTSGKFTLAFAKKYYKDTSKWNEEWQEVKVVSVNKAGTMDFDIPVNELAQMCIDYMSAHNEQAISTNDEQKEG